jgi:hypothetical protein
MNWPISSPIFAIGPDRPRAQAELQVTAVRPRKFRRSWPIHWPISRTWSSYFVARPSRNSSRLPSHWAFKLAEREGFEPPCRLLGKTLSRRPRYDHFGTSPSLARAVAAAATSLRRALRLTALRSHFAARSASFARAISVPATVCAPRRTPGSLRGILPRARAPSPPGDD